MAKLPTRDDLSQPGSLRSGRMISSADTSAIGRGLEALGSGIQQFAEERRRQGVVLDGATADGTSARALNDLERSFDQRSDYDKFGEAWQKGYNQIVAEGAAKISDPNARAVWTQQMAARAEPWRNRVMNLAQTRVAETRRESAVTALEGFQSVIADNNAAEDARNAAKRDADVWISGLQETGILTPSQAADWREKVIRGGDFLFGEREIMAKGSEAISGALPRTTAARATTAMQFFASRGYTKEQAAGIVGNLIAESNLRPSGAVGDNGTAFGIAQWRGERLTRLKRYAASQGRDWQDFETQLSFVDVELQSHETSAYKALKNAKTIDEATAAFIGYERPAGWSTDNPRGGHNYSGRLKSAAQAAGENIPPEWFRNLPADKQFDLEARAAARDDQLDREAAAQAKFAQEQAKDQYSLRIASEDLSLSRETIMADAILDDGQKATLLNSYDAKFKELRATADAMQAFAAGNLRVDPFASDGKKVVDNLFDAAVKNAPDRIQPLTEELVRQTGVVPNSAMSLIRQGLASTNVTDVANAAQAAQRISTINPDVLGRRDGGGEVQTAADDFAFYVNKMNLTPEEAARRIIDGRSPEGKFTRKAMEGAAKEFVKAVEKEDIAAIFNDSWFLADPEVGFSEGQKLGIQAEFVAIAEDQFYAANGDPDVAKNRAIEQMKRLYGVTELTGRKVVMKHPPERYWPKFEITDAAQSLSYPAQLKNDLQEHLRTTDSSGNAIDLSRPEIQNADGSFSTEETITIEDRGKWFNIPTIVSGKRVSDDEAVALFRGGKNKAVGEFDTLQDAETAARKRTEDIGNARRGPLPEIDMSRVQLVATPETDAMVKRGEVPGYSVLYKDENGVLQTIPGKLWRPDFTKLQEMQNRVDDAGTASELEKARANQVQQRQQAPYRVQKQDDFLSGQDPVFGDR